MQSKDLILAVIAVMIAFLLIAFVPKPSHSESRDSAERIGEKLYTQCHMGNRIYMYVTPWAGTITVVPGGCL